MEISKWGRHSCLPQTRRGGVMTVLCLAAFVGCGGGANSGPATIEVTGTVTFGGNPIEGASVVFYPGIGSDDGRLASQAATDRDGRFRLSTQVGGGKSKPGIAPGQYVVAITKLDTAAIKDILTPPKNLLPRKYGDPKTSQLKADVAAGRKNDFPFALKRE